MLTHDLTITIATAHTASSKSWTNKKLLWSEFVDKLRAPVVTSETIKEFLSMPRLDQGRIKDVGGYVGGELRGGRRKPENVMHRQILTLDIDFANEGFWQDFELLYDCAAVLHATHKHQKVDPRLRLLIPLSREVNSDEYEAVARAVAGSIGIDLFDNTTFEVSRLMFWPSVPKDVEYYFEVQDGKFLDPDCVLASYTDWRDVSQWPTADKKLREIGDQAKKQEDPEIKRGIIGVFCRTYTMTEVLDNILQDVYTASTDGRYTYVHGSTASGLVIYDDKFAYSHHGTDPCSGRLVNAFDIVRIHKFGHLDSDDYSGPPSKARSFIAMEDFALSDKAVKKRLAEEKLELVRTEFHDFDVPAEEFDAYEAEVEYDKNWMSELDADKRGAYLSTAKNFNLIFRNDPKLKEAFKLNLFDNKVYVYRTLPWRRVSSPETIRDVDYSGVRNYIETVYGVTGVSKIDDAMSLEIERNTFHPIKEYLESMVWDGVPRIDALLPDYFGAEDDAYTREAMRKMLCGAIARVYEPGCKFDLVMTLVSQDQGMYKSMFIDKLSNGWFSDTFLSVHGKEALEQIQGSWLIEIAELSAFRKSDAESIKHFLSKREDTFRPAFGRSVVTYRRQCVFFGTTNLPEFLRDPSGNRRFMPIQVHPDRIKKSVRDELTASEVAQIWAEAKELYENGEKLYLSEEASKIAQSVVAIHSETDERLGIVEQFLDTPLPENWESMPPSERSLFWMLNEEERERDYPKRLARQYVCVAELWVECLGKSKEDMSRYNTRDLNDIMRSLKAWEACNSTKNFALYGKQKFYKRKQ